MLFDLMKKNFQKSGFSFVRITDLDATLSKTFVVYRVIGNKVYVVIVLDDAKKADWTRDKYQKFVRNVKKVFYDQGAEEVRLLNVIITKHTEKVGRLGLGFDPYWIIDKENLRLMIYEDSVDQFLGVKSILESSLQGKEISIAGQQSSRLQSWRDFPLATIALVMINIILFAVIEILGSTQDLDNMLRWGAMYWEKVVRDHEYYRLFTHMFLHFGMNHLVNNMVVLSLTGHYIENVVGHVKFLLLYLSSGVLAGLVSMLVEMEKQTYVISAGASGAVFGIIGLMMAVVVMNKGKLKDFTFRQMVVLAVLSLYSGFVSQGVDNVAHVSGFISGFILTVLIHLFQGRGKV